LQIILKRYISKLESFPISFKHHCKNVSLSKAVEDEVQSFLELIFSSFKVFIGSRDESETTLQLEQGLGYVKEVNNSRDCNIQTSVHDQNIEISFVGIIGARIRKSNVNKLYQENFSFIYTIARSSNL